MASKPFPDLRRGEWVMKYRPDPTGKWVRVPLGKDPRLTGARPPKTPPQPIIDRHREFAEIEYNAKHGIRSAPARAKGLEGYIEAYLDGFAASHKTASIRQAKRHARSFLAFAQARGVKTVQEVTRTVCRDYLIHRISIVSHDTLRTERGYLAPIWSRAEEDGLVVKSPWIKIKIPGKSTRSAPVFWSSDEVKRIAEHCCKSWQTDLVLVLANTGLRISTALAMRWNWVNWTTGVITIPPEFAAHYDGVKTAYSCAINRVSRTILQKRRTLTHGDLVFPNPYGNGGEVPYDSARAAIQKAIKKAGVKIGTAHDLRHTYARLMDRLGKPGSFVQSQLGHTRPQTTMIYTDATAEEVATSLEEIGFGDDPIPPPTPSLP